MAGVEIYSFVLERIVVLPKYTSSAGFTPILIIVLAESPGNEPILTVGATIL